MELAADVRYALRTWRRQPAFVAVAVLSLAAGIGLNATVFSIINTIFFQSIRGVSDPEQVVNIGGRLSFATFRELRDNSLTVGGAAAWQPVRVDIRVGDLTLRRVVPAVSERYFEVLGVRPARGRFFEPAAPRQPAAVPEVVLDYEFWSEVLGGDSLEPGEAITINGIQATILGVAPQSFHGFGPERPPLWIAMGMMPAIRKTAPTWDDAAEGGWRVFSRLQGATRLADVNAELAALAVRSPELFRAGALRAATGREHWSGPVSAEKQIEFLLVVVLPLVVVGLILWIGCSNVANLLLARAAARRKEIAVRIANGASRARLIRLLLTESLLLAAAGGGLGLLLAAWARDLVWATIPEAPRLAVELDLHVLLYTACVCVVATLLFGAVPALHATRVDVAPLLKGEEPGSGQNRRSARVRTFFLVTQFASSMALLIVAGTFVRSVVNTHVGEQAAMIDHLSLAYIEAAEPAAPMRAEYWRRVRETLGREPGVTAVTLTPSGNGRRIPLIPDGTEPAPGGSEISLQRVDGAFFGAAGLSVVRGSDSVAAPGHGAIPAAAIVNEQTARRFWGTVEVIGKRFTLDGAGTFEVSGVVRDDGAEARVYQGFADGDVTEGNVVIRTSGPSAAAIDGLRRSVMRLSADRAFSRVATMREASTGMLQRLTGLALVIALLVLSLATVGLYGSVSFLTAQRTREIAIRLAIGAPRPAILRMLAREGVRVVCFGSALGLALTAVAFRFMSGMIFATWSLDVPTTAGVLLTFAIATLAACSIPGRRAMRIDPMTVLRAD